MATEIEVTDLTAVAGSSRIPIPVESPPFAVARREAREPRVLHVEYCPFPRASAEQRLRVGFTGDVSASGLRLRSDAAERAGRLLRVVVRDVDGRLEREAVARVAWCRPTGDGFHWVGLALVARCDARPVRAQLGEEPGHRVGIAS